MGEQMSKAADLCGWLMIAALFYGLTLMGCAFDSSCATFFMEPM